MQIIDWTFACGSSTGWRPKRACGSYLRKFSGLINSRKKKNLWKSMIKHEQVWATVSWPLTDFVSLHCGSEITSHTTKRQCAAPPTTQTQFINLKNEDTMILYTLKKYVNEKLSAAYGKFFAYPVVTQTYGLDELAEHMESHNTPFSKGAIKGMLTDMVSCVRELVLQGIAVKIPASPFSASASRTRKVLPPRRSSASPRTLPDWSSVPVAPVSSRQTVWTSMHPWRRPQP